MAELTTRWAQPGRIAWIGLRPARRADMLPVTEADLAETGLLGDHARVGKRALTLFQHEHLAVLASLLGRDGVPPDLLRRCVHVAGLNLGALRGARLCLGTAEVEITGPCAPCSRMEEALGHGGYAAMRGHGGWCARVLRPGRVWCGAEVAPSPAAPPS